MRKLGRRAEATVVPVKRLRECVTGFLQGLVIERRRCSAGGRFELLENLEELFTLSANFIPLFSVEGCDFLQQFGERRHAVARLVREVCAAEEGTFILTVQKHR